MIILEYINKILPDWVRSGIQSHDLGPLEIAIVNGATKCVDITDKYLNHTPDNYDYSELDQFKLPFVLLYFDYDLGLTLKVITKNTQDDLEELLYRPVDEDVTHVCILDYNEQAVKDWNNKVVDRRMNDLYNTGEKVRNYVRKAVSKGSVHRGEISYDEYDFDYDKSGDRKFWKPESITFIIEKVKDLVKHYDQAFAAFKENQPDSESIGPFNYHLRNAHARYTDLFRSNQTGAWYREITFYLKELKRELGILDNITTEIKDQYGEEVLKINATGDTK